MIVFIAPFESLRQQASEVIEQNGLSNIVTCVGNLYEGVRLAEEATRTYGSCVFISRGGTAQFIKAQTKSPVVSISYSNLDILNQLKSVTSEYDRIAVVGFEGLTSVVASISKIMGYPIRTYTIVSEKDVTPILNDITTWDAKIVLGDFISYKYAVAANIESRMIQSGNESIKEAIDKAILLESSLKKQVEAASRANSIIEAITEGALYADPQGKIIQINTVARTILDLPEAELIGSNVFSVLPGAFPTANPAKLNSSINYITEYNNKYLALKLTKIEKNGMLDALLVIIQPHERLQEVDDAVKRKIKSNGFVAKYHFEDICCASNEMADCIQQAREFAKSSGNIVIYGETGTGKELLAQSIHNASPVANGPFVAVNCAAFPLQLLESELFGYEEGAFSGAKKGGATGLFQLANGGTIFLDEIGEMNMELQAKLLRVLQEHEIRKVGGNTIISVNARVIVATNNDLLASVEEGRFRKDLYYRLNILDITLPPLRDRKEDIIPIFIENLTNGTAGNPPGLSEDFKKELLAYSWPGNVRELENFAKRFLVLNSINGPDYAQMILLRRLQPEKQKEARTEDAVSLSGNLREITDRAILKVYELEGHNILRTAKRLGTDRNTIKRRLAL